jgi:hypothetical protein
VPPHLPGLRYEIVRELSVDDLGFVSFLDPRSRKGMVTKREVTKRDGNEKGW